MRPVSRRSPGPPPCAPGSRTPAAWRMRAPGLVELQTRGHFAAPPARMNLSERARRRASWPRRGGARRAPALREVWSPPRLSSTIALPGESGERRPAVTLEPPLRGRPRARRYARATRCRTRPGSRKTAPAGKRTEARVEVVEALVDEPERHDRSMPRSSASWRCAVRARCGRHSHPRGARCPGCTSGVPFALERALSGQLDDPEPALAKTTRRSAVSGRRLRDAKGAPGRRRRPRTSPPFA